MFQVCSSLCASLEVSWLPDNMRTQNALLTSLGHDSASVKKLQTHDYNWLQLDYKRFSQKVRAGRCICFLNHLLYTQVHNWSMLNLLLNFLVIRSFLSYLDSSWYTTSRVPSCIMYCASSRRSKRPSLSRSAPSKMRSAGCCGPSNRSQKLKASWHRRTANHCICQGIWVCGVSVEHPAYLHILCALGHGRHEWHGFPLRFVTNVTSVVEIPQGKS